MHDQWHCKPIIILANFNQVRTNFFTTKAARLRNFSIACWYDFREATSYLIALTLLTQLTGCANANNGFHQFYTDLAGPTITNLAPYSGATTISDLSNGSNDVKEMMRNGYALIGSSCFQGPAQANGALKWQARQVGADKVLLSTTYLGSEQTAAPVMQYNLGQTYTTTSTGTVNGSAYGNGGYAYGTGNYNGTSTTTTPGSFSTQMIPVTIHRYQYDAGFFRHMQPTVLGLFTRPLPEEARQQLQRNTGVIVWIVRNASPAFDANILEGDVILQVNDENISTPQDFVAKVSKLFGQKARFSIWRGGQMKTIVVQLNNKA